MIVIFKKEVSESVQKISQFICLEIAFFPSKSLYLNFFCNLTTLYTLQLKFLLQKVLFNKLSFCNQNSFQNKLLVVLSATHSRADTSSLSKKQYKLDCGFSQLDCYALTKTELQMTQ